MGSMPTGPQNMDREDTRDREAGHRWGGGGAGWGVNYMIVVEVGYNIVQWEGIRVSIGLLVYILSH